MGFSRDGVTGGYPVVPVSVVYWLQNGRRVTTPPRDDGVDVVKPAAQGVAGCGLAAGTALVESARPGVIRSQLSRTESKPERPRHRPAGRTCLPRSCGRPAKTGVSLAPRFVAPVEGFANHRLRGVAGCARLGDSFAETVFDLVGPRELNAYDHERDADSQCLLQRGTRCGAIRLDAPGVSREGNCRFPIERSHGATGTGVPGRPTGRVRKHRMTRRNQATPTAPSVESQPARAQPPLALMDQAQAVTSTLPSVLLANQQNANDSTRRHETCQLVEGKVISDVGGVGVEGPDLPSRRRMRHPAAGTVRS